MSNITQFFDHPFFTTIGGILLLITILSILPAIYFVTKGFFSTWYRLSLCLYKKKVAIFSDTEFEDLRDMLIESNLFHKRNIVKVDRKSLKKSEDISLFIVHYASYKNDLDEVLKLKKHLDGMIVYAPQEEGRIETEILQKLNNERNTIIVNFRGRLLNDVFVSMMTTGGKKI